MNAKRIAGLVAIALLLFLVIGNPSHAASMVQGIVAFLRHGAEAIISFVSNIFNRH